MPRKRREPFERAAHYCDAEVAPAVAGAGMAGVQVALVLHGQRLLLDCGLDGVADGSDALLAWKLAGRHVAHGSTGLNGRTSTRSYTPAST